MYERTRSSSSGSYYSNAAAKMNDIGPRKTVLVLIVVVGCFAILWPKVFYPMLVGSANQHMKPSPIDKTTGCCDVFSETDIDTIRIMSELCSNIIEQSSERPLSGKEIVTRCNNEVQQTCGIDISAVLQEPIRLGRTVKQILNEIRSLNGSLCLKYHYGVAPWRLGVPHRIAVNVTSHVRQERPPHMRPDIIHPAFRERGSAIPRVSPSSKKPPKIVEGRPGPIPGMRPTLGGAGRVVPPSQKTGSSMSVIMPIYTIGIVIFFTYTLMKLLFKKQPDGVGGSLYPPVEPDPRFRKEVFESERCRYTPRLSRDPTGKIGDEVAQLRNRLQETERAMERIIHQMSRVPLILQAKTASSSTATSALARSRLTNSDNVANGSVPQRSAGGTQEQTSVKILGMETTASCEGGQRWTKRIEPMVAIPHTIVEEKTPPQEIYLQGALPAQSQILVSDSATVTESAQFDVNGSDPAVVLAGKMTLSVISLDGEKPKENHAIPSISVQTPEMIDLNGENNGDNNTEVDDSKYTTASSATMAERDISEGADTDDEIAEDIEKIDDLELEMNHTPQVSNGVNVEEEIAKASEEFTEEIVEQIVDEIEEIVLVEERNTEAQQVQSQPKEDVGEEGGKPHPEEQNIQSNEIMKTIENEGNIEEDSEVKLAEASREDVAIDEISDEKLDDIVNLERDEVLEEIKDVQVTEKTHEDPQKDESLKIEEIEATKVGDGKLEQKLEEDQKIDEVEVIEKTNEILQEQITVNDDPTAADNIEEMSLKSEQEVTPKSTEMMAGIGQVLEEIKEVQVAQTNEDIQKEEPLKINEATKVGDVNLEEKLEEDQKIYEVEAIEQTNENLQKQIAEKDEPVTAGKVAETAAKTERIDVPKSTQSITNIEESTDKHDLTNKEEDQLRKDGIEEAATKDETTDEEASRIVKNKEETEKNEPSTVDSEENKREAIKKKEMQSDKNEKSQEAIPKEGREPEEIPPVATKAKKDAKTEDELIAIEDDDEEVEEEEEVEDEEVEEEEEIEMDEEIEEIEMTDEEDVEDDIDIEYQVNGGETEE